MDLKQEDILNVEIDAAFLLSYGINNLSLEGKDMFVELPDEIASDDIPEDIASDDKPDISSSLLTKNIKAVRAEDSDINHYSKHTSINIKVENEELYESEIKAEVKKEKKDINGNEEIATFQNLNELLIKLELSDSGNEDEFEEIERLRERGPLRSCTKTSKRLKKKLYSRQKEYDKTLFNSEKLRFLAGSSQVETDNLSSAGPSYAPDYVFYDNVSPLPTHTESLGYTSSNNDVFYEEFRANSLNSPESGSSSILSGSSQVETDNLSSAGLSNAPDYVFYDNVSPLPTHTESLGYTSSNNDVFYEEFGANSLNSPESGYETSSISGGSPPPQFSAPVVNPSLDLSLDEIIDVVVELESTTNYVSPAFNHLSCIDEKCVGKLVEYLEDTTGLQNDIFDTDSSCTNKISVSASNQADLNVKNDCFLPASQVQPRSETDEKYYDNEIYFHKKSPNFQVELSSIQHTDEIPVPINDVDLNNISSVEPLSLSNNIQQRVDTPKKISIKPLENKAKIELKKVLSKDKIFASKRRIYKKAIEDKKKDKEINIIYVVDENDGTSENRTNLHMAVLNFKLEEIYTLVEIHKQYNKPFNDLNNRDKYGKTALDYAMQKNMPLVVEYLKENMVCQGVNI